MFLKKNITSKYLWKIFKKHDISKYHLKPLKYQHFDFPGLTQGSPQTSKITPRAPQDAPRTFPGPQGCPWTSQETPKGPQGSSKDLQSTPKDPQASQKHAHSTSLIPKSMQSIPKARPQHPPNLSKEACVSQKHLPLPNTDNFCILSTSRFPSKSLIPQICLKQSESMLPASLSSRKSLLSEEAHASQKVF